MKQTLTLAVAAALVLSACGDRESSSSIADNAAALQARMNTDTLMAGGQPVVFTYREFTGGATFPAPFAVRYPEGLAVTADRAAMGDIVRLTQNADSAAGVWSLTFLPEGTTEDAARTTTMDAAGRLGAATADSAAGALASQSGSTSRVWLGQHAGRYVVVQSSAGDAAAWDAFAPRAAYVEEHWTWSDDGSALRG